jgi:TolB-like protein/Tfp pilus assembly protein PilF
MTLSVGTKLGPYEVLAPLGAGGMGEVYRARDGRLEREVAIKVLPEHLAQDRQALARFERETKAVAALSHPGILAIYDVGTEQGVVYAVMELLEGETLRARMGRSTMPWRKVVEIGVATADGLAAAHSKGIVHRDLKPENIFLTSDGRVKILDFGLARWKPRVAGGNSQTPTETDAGTVMGTVGYMSPEQVRGMGAEAPSDIFSLGCVLYEMATGERAFARGTAIETLSAILNEDPPALSDSGKGVPPDLGGIIHHCLEKNTEQRFQSARDLAFALRAASGSGGSSVAAAPARGRKRLGRWAWAGAAVVLLAGTGFFMWRITSGRAIDSLAVLPFVNVGGDPSLEYLSDGITENLINSLSQLQRLRVVPRGRAFRYKGRETDAERAGRELNVRAVLTGRVAQRGDNLNIQTELVDLATDSQLWGRQYDRKLSEIIPVQEEIAKEVSEKLRLRPMGEEQRRLTRRYTENPEAHQLYLKGRYLWNRRTGDALRQAAEYFRQSIDKDPTYALAWAGLTDCYVLSSFYSGLPPKEAASKAKESARRALALDDTLAEPHAALAYVKTFYDWDWPGAEREFTRAIELNPNYATAHHWYGLYLDAVGRPDEGIAEVRRAQEADPLSLTISTTAGAAFFMARRYDQAVEQLHKTLEMDPNFPGAHLWLGLVHEQMGRGEEAIAELQKAASLSGGEPAELGLRGHAYASAGRRAEAQRVLAELNGLSKRSYVPPFDIALVYAGLGEKRQSLEWLERAYEDHSFRLTWIKVWPQLDSLRGESRFHDLLRRMNLVQ